MPLLQRKIHQKALSAFFIFLLLISSCAVKAALSHAVNVEYSKPLNPSKTASAAGLCLVADVKGPVYEVLFRQNKTAFNVVTFAGGNILFVFVKFCFTVNNKTLLKVPLYILFKKMKLFIS